MLCKRITASLLFLLGLTVIAKAKENAPPVPTIRMAKVTDAIEGGTNGQYKVFLNLPVYQSQDIVITFNVTGSATSSVDYNMLGLSAGQIVIPAGAAEVYIDVDAGNDGIIEGPENVTLTITGASSTSTSYTIDPGATTGTVNIVDANAASTTPIQIITGTNGAEPATNASFTIKLAGVATSAWPVTIGYRLSGTAMLNADYTTTGSIVIPANTNSVIVPLNVIDDHIFEPTEFATITLLSGSATDGGGNAFIFPPDPANDDITVNIAENDFNYVLSVQKGTDAAEPNTKGSFIVKLPDDYVSAANTTLNYSMSGTATRNTDYTMSTITLPAYHNSIEIPLNTIDDNIIENTETALFTLNGGTDGNSFTYNPDPAAKTATLNISDNDNTRVLNVDKIIDAAEPVTNGRFRIGLLPGVTCSETITVNYTVSGTATTGSDYMPLSGSIVLPVGQNSVDLPVIVSDDQVIENTETVTVTLAGGSSTSFTFTGTGSATVNMTDEDNIPANRAFTIGDNNDATEPATNGSFRFKLPPGMTASEDVTIQYTVAGTATSNADYIPLSGSVVLPAGQNSVPVPVMVKNDQVIEPAETVQITLVSASSANFTFTGANANTVYVFDEDDIPANKVLSITKLADAAEPATHGSFSIQLPSGILTSEPITVSYTISGTATNGVDYSTLPGTVVLPAGANNVTFSVPVINDNNFENTETVVCTLNGGTSTSFTFTGTGSATMNITDDENIVANRILSVTKTADAAEPATNGAFRIHLPAGITVPENITVNYSIAGTATRGTDYALLSNVVLLAGQNSTSLPVIVTDDAINENAETVVLTLTGGTSDSYSFTPSASAGNATVNITDNDMPPYVTSVAVPANGYYKAGNVLGFTVNFSENVTVTGTPSLAVNVGTATVQAGYTSGSGTNALTFSYTVVPGDMDMDGIALGSLGLNGGTIQNAATTNVTLTLNSVGNTSGVFVNTAHPSVTLSTTSATRINAPFPITITFSEAATGLTTGDFTVTNASVSNLQTTNNIVYTAELTPAADGAVSVQLPAGTVVNIAGNDNTASNTLSFTYDATPPVITAGQSFTILQNSAAGTQVGKVTASDASGILQNWAMSSGGAFAIDQNGNITVNDVALLNSHAGTTITVQVTVTDGLNTSVATSVSIQVLLINQAPTLDAINNVTTCANTDDHTIQLTGASATEPNQTYSFTIQSNQDYFEVLTVNASGLIAYRLKPGATAGVATVTVTIKDNGGTANGGVDAFSRSFTVTINSLPVITITSDKGLNISKGDIVHLTATGGATYNWNDANGIISGQQTSVLEARPQQNTTYTVNAASTAGCNSTASINITVIEDFKVDATNILTPNGDGRNDRWVVRNIDVYPDNEVRIYDRAGRLVYQKRNYNNEWNGMYNGNPLAEGTYYYILTIQNGVKTAKGAITIIRDKY